MSRTTAVSVLAAALLLAGARPASAQRDAAAQLAVAESALARGQMDRAVDLAREYTSHHSDDWRGWFLQGEATLRRGGASNAHRVAAIIAFRHATRLAPERPEVWDGYGRAGLELGNADGELILHEAYERVLALDPLYPTAFENWLKAYRAESDRERLRRILAQHDSIPEVRARIAQLLIEDERYAAADTVLDALLALDGKEPAWLALRGQSALEKGDTVTGSALYEQALAYAGRAGGELLWQQAIGIATPAEIRAWEAGIPAEQRSGFLRSFWARRNPDLFAGINRRIAEHFARLRVVRKQFQATHPLAGYKNRSLTRALAARASVGEQIFYLRCEAGEVGPMHATDQARVTSRMEDLLADPLIWNSWRHGIQPPGEFFIDLQKYRVGLLDVPYGPDIRDIDTTAAALGYNLRTGLDDRGLTYLRFGPPRQRIVGSLNAGDPFCALPDLERWQYDDIGTVRFFRPEAVNVGALAGWATTGEQVFRPMNETQFKAMEQAMTRNATSIPAPLTFGVWTAQFAGADSGTTDVVVVTTRGAAAAQLVAPAEEEGTPREDSSGVVVLTARKGWYSLVANAKLGDTLGRMSLPFSVLTLGHTWGVSDLLLAPVWTDTVTTRSAMLHRLQRDLTFPAGTTLRAYAEVYGLQTAADSYVSYRASYQIVRSNDLTGDARQAELPGGIRLAFERQQPSEGGPTVEWLDIAPGQIPPGRYLLRLEVREPTGVKVIGRAQIGFEILPQ